MPPPFPGMDPYLEHRRVWEDIHSSLIAAIRDSLGPVLRPRYYVSLRERVHVQIFAGGEFEAKPDLAVVRPSPPEPPGGASTSVSTVAQAIPVLVPVQDEVKVWYLEIHKVGDDRIVTMIEILSPTNKRPGKHREQYLRKRDAFLHSKMNLVEIDLLRDGDPMPLSRGPGRRFDYRILVSRASQRPRAELFAFDVRQTIPPFRVPLLPGDEEPEVDLGALLRGVYDRGSFDLRVRYDLEPDPPLRIEDRGWAHELLKGPGAR